MSRTTYVIIAALLLVGAVVIIVALPMGPVVATLTQTHGVHLGDLLTSVPMGVLAMALLWKARKGGSSR